MLKIILHLKNLYTWLLEWMTGTDLKQAVLYVLMVVMLLYIASKLTGWLAVGLSVAAILYGGYMLWLNFGQTFFKKLVKTAEEEKEQEEN